MSVPLAVARLRNNRGEITVRHASTAIVEHLRSQGREGTIGVTTEHGRWSVTSHPAFDTWLEAIGQDNQEKVAALVRLLRQHGPNLGRPYADRIKGSNYKNLKELRPTSKTDEALRVLFYFDRRRDAVLLVGGDKAGNWTQWYAENIPIAEQRIDEHLKTVDYEERRAAEAARSTARPGRTKNRRRRK